MLNRARNYFASFDRRLWVLAASWMVNGLGFSMVLPFLSLYLTKVRGITMSQVGIILLIAGLCRAFGQLVGGDVTHRLGCRSAIILAQVARVASYVALAAVLHFEGPMPAIAALISCSYLAGAVFQCSADVLTARLTSGQQRVEAYGLSRVGLNVGWMSGPAIGAFLAKTPYSLLFLLAAIVSSTSLVMIFFLVRGVGDTRSGISTRRTMTALLGALANRTFLVFCGAWLLMTLLTSQLVSTISVYTTEVTGISKFQLGWLYTVNGLICIVFQMPMAALLKRLRLPAVMVMGALIYACGYLSFAWQAGFAGLIASVVVITVGEIIVNPSATAMSSLLSKPENLARNMGFFGLVRGVGFAVGPLVGGVLFDVYRGQPIRLWTVLASFGVAAAVGFTVLGMLRGVPRGQTGAGPEVRDRS